MDLDHDGMSPLNKAIIDQHREQNGEAKLSHDQWLRLKEHQRRLRKALILEAKRDLFEKLAQKQASIEIENESRLRRMYAWEEKKLLGEAINKEEEMRKKEREHLQKETKR